jgi:hypothetical protein
VLVLSAVLEHIPEVHRFVEYVKQWLTLDGMLVLEVPDAENFAKAFNAPYQEFSIEHINFFSAPAADNLLGVHGFSRIAVQHELCDAGSNLTGPVLTMMFRRGAPTRPPVRELVTESGVRAYLQTCRDRVNFERGVIDKLIETQTPILVWGVGTLCQRLLPSTRLKEANICAFVDSNPHYQGSNLVGRPVLAPAGLPGRAEPILILSWGFFDEIRLQIREELQLNNEIIRIDMATSEASTRTC